MKVLFAIAVAIALTTAPVAHSQTVDTKADLQKAATDWMDAYNKKDATIVGKMYSANAMMSGPGWTASGEAAIEDGMKKDMAAGVFSKITSITVDQSQRVGDMNYAMGAWTADMNLGGKDTPVGGHWLSVSKYHDGQYSIMMHNINMQMPPPPK
jgi:ketosteroid isomerase-like protein